MIRTLTAIVLVAVLAGACGGSDDGDAASRAGDTTSSTTVAGVAGNAPAAVTTTAQTSPGASPAGRESTRRQSAPTTSSKALAMQAELASPCVRPGGSQTITIKAPPMSAVGYSAVYSDGKTGMDPGHYGGNRAGHTDGTGTWTDTWIVAPNAPAGPVRVDVVGTDSSGATGNATASFTVANAKGEC